MRRKISALVAIATLVMGVSLFAAPSVSQAGTIDCIGVTNGVPGGSFTGPAATCGTINGTITWTSTAPNTFPIVLAPGETAVFTMNQAAVNSTLPTGLPGFNFDTSDKGTANYSLIINGIPIFLDANVLNFGGVDNPSSTTINEATNWVKIAGVGSVTAHAAIPDGHGGFFDVYTGYADTLHSAPCNDPGANCLPFIAGGGILSTWDGSGGSTAATHFLGHGSSLPGYPASTHCNVNQANPALADCFDAGAIMLVELPRTIVPEPSTLFLLGLSLMGVAFYGGRRLKKS